MFTANEVIMNQLFFIEYFPLIYVVNEHVPENTSIYSLRRWADGGDDARKKERKRRINHRTVPYVHCVVMCRPPSEGGFFKARNKPLGVGG